MQELWFLHSALRLVLIDIYMKFIEDIMKQISIYSADTKLCYKVPMEITQKV